MAKERKERGFNKKQISQLQYLFAEGIDKHVTPQFEDVHKELVEIQGTLKDHTNRLGRIETKQDAQQTMLDSHDRRLDRFEKHPDLPAI